jgi:hypothetical protein
MSTGPFTACARPRPRPPRPGRARSSSPCSSGGTRACRRSPRRRRFDAQRRQPVQLGELGPVDVGGAVDHRSALTGRSSGTSTTGLAGPDDYQAAASRCVRSKSSTERHRTPGYRVLATRTERARCPSAHRATTSRPSAAVGARARGRACSCHRQLHDDESADRSRSTRPCVLRTGTDPPKPGAHRYRAEPCSSGCSSSSLDRRSN